MNVVRVWDLPTRVFHWSLAAAVPTMVLTGQVGGAWMKWHFLLGYTVIALLLFRVIWGFFGGYWSRFSTFVHRPHMVIGYLRQREGSAMSVGHNPLGGYSVLAMLLTLLAQAASGLMSDDEILSAGPLAHRLPEAMVRAMTFLHTGPGKWVVILLLLLHVLAIAWYRVGRSENLIRPMLNGEKSLQQEAPESRDDNQARGLALILLLCCATLIAAMLAWARQ